ncbi:bifunctional DNA primase/polymerase [Azospirillum doebereinerae]|uniref:bifunctional DNA primase/polymerase n=1 Tax=Azospirillum doebereinerae TaxID=92933 RepID=UPI001EE5B930|nr:bifunctional DNA primase/polymerase [Azospirillum doebereinerae]MCG5239544.1 bifunctional DNA primase/polymerase [Azospirillum doebereinerae]
MTETAGPELFAAASSYAARGWAVFPCVAGGKLPYKEKDFFEHGVNDAKTSPYWVGAYWKRWPAANVGLAAGESSGFWVLDADIKAPTDDKPGENGFETLRILEELFGEPLPETLGQDTPSGGRHWLFRWPGRAVKNSARSRLGPGLDTRSSGGYIVAAPSIHPNGGRYAWIGSPETTPVAPAPEWVVRLLMGEPDDLEWLRLRLDGRELPAFLAKRIGQPVPAASRALNSTKTERISAYARAALDDEVKKVRQTGPGNQNNALNEAAFALGGLVETGALPEALVHQHLMAAALSWTIDPRKGGWKPEHLEKIIGGGITAGRSHPREVPAPKEQPRRFQQQRRRRGEPSPAALGMQMAAGRAVWALRSPTLDGTPAAAWLAANRVDPATAGPWFGFAELDYLHGPDGAEPRCVGRFPALLAGMARWPDRDGKPEVRAVLATYLTPDGSDTASVHDPDTGEVLPARRLIGAWQGAAVRLGRLAGERLHLTTGAVVGMQTRNAYPGVPVWIGGPVSALLHLSLPDAVRDVVVIGADTASDELRARVARALGGDGRVTVRFPPRRVRNGGSARG